MATDNESPNHHLEPLTNALLQIVLERGYRYSEEPFVLSSGGTSHDYVDLRRALSEGAALRLSADAVLVALETRGWRFDAFGGMTMGADPVAHAVALLAPSAWFSVRKQDKSHGTGQRVEGAELGPAKQVVVFEDTVSTGRSVLDAVDTVAATGVQIVGACTLLDRGEAATAAFAERKIPYFSLLSYRDLDIEPLSSIGAAGADGKARP